MAGLLQQGMQQGQRPPGPGSSEQGGGQQMDESGMRGDPGAQFKPLVEHMMTYLYDQAMPQVERALSSGDPVESMGQIIGMVMSSAYNALRDEGKTVDPPVMVRAAIEMSKAVGEIAMEMGVLPDEGGDGAIETAMMRGLAHFGQTANDMPPEEKQHYSRLIQGLKEGKKASQGGRQQPARGGNAPQQQPMQGGR